MAKVKVKFKYPIFENGRSYDANEIVEIEKEELKRWKESDYTFVGKFEKEKKKKTKDIKIEDKETIDIATL